MLEKILEMTLALCFLLMFVIIGIISGDMIIYVGTLLFMIPFIYMYGGMEDLNNYLLKRK